MTTEDRDATITAVATMATLRAVLAHLALNDRATFTAIQCTVKAAVGQVITDGDQSFREDVHSRAQKLFFSHL